MEKIKEKALEALEWIEEELEMLEGDSMYQWEKKDKIDTIRKAIKE